MNQGKKVQDKIGWVILDIKEPYQNKVIEFGTLSALDDYIFELLDSDKVWMKVVVFDSGS